MLPKRVLDLKVSSNDQNALKLFESNGICASYMCLSYCWGLKGCDFKTTSRNLNAYQRKIAFEDLPTTVREAVIFTRWLGIRYLWIDALYIIQDSRSEWERESGCMASIYENSFFTLSAARAADSGGGFFSNTNCSAQQTDLFCEEKGSGVDATFPLLSCAWAFQERILSPRILHFGDKELDWECRRLDCLRQRKLLVEKYSEHHLTFATDRLPAMSGLVKQIQRNELVSNYVAGIWDNDPGALLWHIRGDPLQPTPTYIAPSWSWASSGKIAR
ncbi:HET-domain-containing protein [Setomelanomma holmii]|uniref:HET-domain-containing protein n=1 Tax=Setomelanomma holmii TaxID=210430 RepID=A0A9P4HJ03_9PLEO|nr:HET-domain-containing protein [Setomelanomma holmii]